jgi:hypothetical protein
MAQFDTFEQDYKKANDLYNKIQNELKERAKLQAAGNPTTKLDYIISNGLETLKYEARNLDKLAYFYINEPDKFNISSKEIKKRQQKVEKFIEMKEQLESDISKIIKGSIRKFSITFVIKF